MTGDIDFFLSASADNESLTRSVLERFGFGQALPPADRSLFEKKVIMLGRPPHRIDLITAIDGVTFSEAWATREQGLLDSLPVWYISKRELIRNKRATGRAKDRLDVEILESFA